LSSPDLELTRRVLAGDEQAFREFFDGCFPVLYRFALARLRQDPDVAEEIVQATLCKAIPKLATYRGEASLLTWLCTFCRHEISAYFSRPGSRSKAVELTEDNPEVASALESLMTSANDPESALQRRELTRLVHVTLDHLPGRYADALEWKYVEGLSVHDIAARLALSHKAAESLLTRAREAFRDGFSALTRSPGARGPALPEVL